MLCGKRLRAFRKRLKATKKAVNNGGLNAYLPAFQLNIIPTKNELGLQLEPQLEPQFSVEHLK